MLTSVRELKRLQASGPYSLDLVTSLTKLRISNTCARISVVTYLSLASFAWPGNDLNLLSSGLILENGSVSSFP